jgi:hypothetical protein
MLRIPREVIEHKLGIDVTPTFGIIKFIAKIEVH